MGWDSIIAQKAKKGAEYAGKFIANGGHAQQAIPAQHRLFNAGLMFVGWKAGDVLRDICFGVNQVTEGEYVPIKREDVPAPLRFLHKSVDWDPHSEAPSDQWKKILHQMMPAAGAAVGAVAGSMFAFELNGRAQAFTDTKKLGKLGLMDAEMAAQYSQSAPLRALAGAFGTFSAASGLTFLYGLFLNASFAAANGAKIFTGKIAHGNMGPAKALENVLGSVKNYAKHALEHKGEMNPAVAESFVTKVLEPMFGHQLDTPELQAKARETIQRLVQTSFDKFKDSGKTAEEIATAVTKDLTAIIGKKGIDETLTKEFGLDISKAMLGNATPVVRKMVTPFQKVRTAIGSTTTEQGFLDRVQTPAHSPAGLGA